MKKNIIITIIILIILAAIAFAFYWFYLKPATQIEENLPPTSGGVLPTITAGPIVSPSTVETELAQKPVLKPLISKDILAFWQSSTSSIQYLTTEGLFEFNYLESPIKEEKRELGVNFSNILNIEPSTKDKILIQYIAEGATKPAYSVLDINTREVKNLDLNIKTATWSPDGEKLLYYYSDSPIYYQENFKPSSYLAQLDKNLANRKVLMNFTAASDLNLIWPATSTAYITQKPSGLVEATVLSFNLANNTFSPFVSGYGLILKWDHQGKYGLLFTTSQNGINPKLQLINKDGYVLADFPNVTLPEKCVFANSKPVLYCSIFVNPVFSGVWPDAYYMNALDFDETLYQINLEKMEAKLLINTPFQINDLKISKDDNYLFFYDEKSKTLYSLSLPQEEVSPSPSISPSPPSSLSPSPTAKSPSPAAKTPSPTVSR